MEIKVVKIPSIQYTEPEIELTSSVKAVKMPRFEDNSSKDDSISTGKIITLDAKKSSEEIIENFVKDLSDKTYNELISEIIVRFNTEPRRYEKLDFGKLILALLKERLIAEEQADEILQQLEMKVDYNSLQRISEELIEKLFL